MSYSPLFPAFLLLFLLTLLSTPALAQSQPDDLAAPDNISELRQRSLALVNRSRARADLPPLELAEPLNLAAQRHAADMLARTYFAHEAPDGGTARDRYGAAGGSEAQIVRENIARCQSCRGPLNDRAIARLHAGWMNSPEHRANILATGLTHYGFGLATRGGDIYSVETFSGPGVSRSAGKSGGDEAIGASEQSKLAAALINDLRTREIKASPALSHYIQSKLPSKNLANVDLNRLNIIGGKPAGVSARQFQVLAGKCGGCGPEATAGAVDPPGARPPATLPPA